MSVTVRNRRDFKRIPVPSERAQVLVVIHEQEHRAVMADMSSAGFGVYVLPGVMIEPGLRLQLICDEGIHVCEVTHLRSEGDFEFIGLKRTATLPLIETPRPAKERRWYRFKFSGGTPMGFILFCCLLSFTCTAGFVALQPFLTKLLDTVAMPGQRDDRAPDLNPAARSQHDMLIGGRRVSVEQSSLARRTSGADQQAQADANQASREERQGLVLARLFGAEAPDWDDFTRRLRLSEVQQERLLKLLGSPELASVGQSRAAAQSRLLSLLDDSQRIAFARMVAEIAPR